jgi:hypothetical protein
MELSYTEFGQESPPGSLPEGHHPLLYENENTRKFFDLDRIPEDGARSASPHAVIPGRPIGAEPGISSERAQFFSLISEVPGSTLARRPGTTMPDPREKRAP